MAFGLPTWTRFELIYLDTYTDVHRLYHACMHACLETLGIYARFKVKLSRGGFWAGEIRTGWDGKDRTGMTRFRLR